MFPLQEVSQVQPMEPDFEKRLDRLQRVHQNMVMREVKPGTSTSLVRPGQKYRRYKVVDDIPEKGRLLFKLAGKLDLASCTNTC